MFRPRPFGKSYSDVTSRPGKRLSGAHWERLFTTRKRTLMDKANKLANDAACFVTLTVKSPAGETWFYATTEELRKALFKSGLINASSIQVTRETLDQNLLLQGKPVNITDLDVENIPVYTPTESRLEEGDKNKKINTTSNAPTLIKCSNNFEKSHPLESNNTKNNVSLNLSENVPTRKRKNEKTKKNCTTSASINDASIGKKSRTQTVPPSHHHPFVMPQSAKNTRKTTNFDEINNNIRSGNHTFFTDENLESELQKTRKKTATTTPKTPPEPESDGESESSSETTSTSSSDSDDSTSSSSGDSSSDSDASSKKSQQKTPNSLQTTTTVTTVFKKESAVDSIPPFPQNATSISDVEITEKNNPSIPLRKEDTKTSNANCKLLKSGNCNSPKSKSTVDTDAGVPKQENPARKKDTTMSKKKTAVVKDRVQTKIQSPKTSRTGDNVAKELPKTKKFANKIGQSGKNSVAETVIELAKNNDEDVPKVKKPLKKIASRTKKQKSNLSNHSKKIDVKNSEKDTDNTRSKKIPESPKCNRQENPSKNNIPDRDSVKNIPSVREIKRENLINPCPETNPYHFTSNMTPKKANSSSDRKSKSPHLKRSLEKKDFSKNKGPIKNTFISEKILNDGRDISKSEETVKKTGIGDTTLQIRPNSRRGKSHEAQHFPRNNENQQRNRSRSPWNKSLHESDISRRKRCHSLNYDHRPQHPEKNDEFRWKRQRFNDEHDLLFQNHQFLRNEPSILGDRHSNEYWDIHHGKPWERDFAENRSNRSDINDHLRNIANYDEWEADILASLSSSHDFPQRPNVFRNERDTLLPKTTPNTFKYGWQKKMPRPGHAGKNVPRHQRNIVPPPRHEDQNMPQPLMTLLPKTTQNNFNYGWQKKMPQPGHAGENMPRHDNNIVPPARYEEQNTPQPLLNNKNMPRPLLEQSKRPWHNRYRAKEKVHFPQPAEQTSTKNWSIDRKSDKDISTPFTTKPNFSPSPRQQASKHHRFNNKKIGKNNSPPHPVSRKTQYGAKNTEKNAPKHTFFTDNESSKGNDASMGKSSSFFLNTDGTKGNDDAMEKPNFNKKYTKKSPRVNYRRKFKTSNQDKRRKSAPVAQVKPFNQEVNKHSYNGRSRR